MDDHLDDDDWGSPLPTYVLRGHPGYPDTEVAIHRREGDRAFVSSVSWHSKHTFWVGAQYVHELRPEEACRLP